MSMLKKKHKKIHPFILENSLPIYLRLIKVENTKAKNSEAKSQY